MTISNNSGKNEADSSKVSGMMITRNMKRKLEDKKSNMQQGCSANGTEVHLGKRDINKLNSNDDEGYQLRQFKAYPDLRMCSFLR